MGLGMHPPYSMRNFMQLGSHTFNYYINSDSIYTKYILGGYGIYAIAFVEIDTQVEV